MPQRLERSSTSVGRSRSQAVPASPRASTMRWANAGGMTSGAGDITDGPEVSRENPSPPVPPTMGPLYPHGPLALARASLLATAAILSFAAPRQSRSGYLPNHE